MGKVIKRAYLEPGDTILNGRYQILKIIHTSGMANVYLVSDSNLNKQWCLKEIKKSESGKNQVEYYSLLQEANIMKSLNHASIPRIVTIEEDGDSLFIVMDYVDGLSIKNWIQQKGKISQTVVVTWMKQICQVMMYLHNRKQPIFYRDMKPDNVMIQSDGNIKLLDFGISIVIKEKGQKIERALGTKGYAAPEQSKRGNVCDLRSDIYAMGKTMYYMLTGLNPSQIPKDKIKPVRDIDPSISIGLEKIVNRCTQEDPDDRYQNCEELLYDLQNYVVLDTKYRKKARTKINLVCLMFLSSIFLFIMSFVPLGMYRTQQENEYNVLLATANQSGKAEDYIAVLNSDSNEVEPYLGYIENIKLDGIFSKDEETTILNYLNPSLETLQKKDGYGELAYNMGKLYWFYYVGDSSEEGVVTSTKWFQDAKEAGYEVDASTIYCNLGLFKKNITSSITESDDAGMYKEYWDNLIAAKDMSGNGELVNLQLNIAISDCISTYAYKLRSDGVSYLDIKKEVEDLIAFSKSYTPSLQKAEILFKPFKNTLEGLQQKVDVAYGGGENNA